MKFLPIILIIFLLTTPILTYKWCPKQSTVKCDPATDSDTCQIAPAHSSCEVTNPGQLCCSDACDKLHCMDPVEQSPRAALIKKMFQKWNLHAQEEGI